MGCMKRKLEHKMFGALTPGERGRAYCSYVDRLNALDLAAGRERGYSVRAWLEGRRVEWLATSTQQVVHRGSRKGAPTSQGAKSDARCKTRTRRLTPLLNP